ncbi:unnamed protein product [Rotaria magnacalcarata]
MELSFNNKEKMNDSGSTFLPNISHVNSAEAFRTSNVNQSTSDVVVEEEKIHELLDKAISSTRIEDDNNGTDQNVQKKNKIGNQSQRNSNDRGASNSSFTQPARQQFTPHAIRTTSLNSSCILKSPTIRLSSGSSVMLNQNRRNCDDLHSGTMSEQVKQNKMRLQALPKYGSLERDVKFFARRSSPSASFSMRQLRNAFGMSIQQPRYRQSLSNRNISALGEKLKTISSDKNASSDYETDYINTVQYNDNEII